MEELLENGREEKSFCSETTGSCKKCVKCNGEATNESNRVYYCEECFVKMVKGKFRSTLSKRKIFRDKESRKAIVVLDGSKESAYLFRLIEDSVKQTSFKRLMIDPSFVILLSSPDALEASLVEKKLSVLRNALPRTFYVLHLAAVLGEMRLDSNGGYIGLENLSKLAELCSSFKSASSCEEMLRLLEIRLIKRFAKLIGVSKVLVPSNSDQLARLTMTQLCIGRGSRVSDMVSVVENTAAGVTFIRPLRNVSSDEISTALRLEDVEHYVLLPEASAPTSSFSYVHEAASKGSIQGCVSQYVGRLIEDGFKGTVPNILGSADKIHCRTGASQCTLCDYSFTGEGTLCYTCCFITKELPSSVLTSILSLEAV